MDEEIFRISKNEARARSLLEMAMDRLEDISRESKTYKIVEEYYEIIKELITALMYSDGFKTLSHKMLLVYLEKNYPEFDRSEVILIDNLRKLRNDIVYYGQRVEKEFLINHKDDILRVIKRLENAVKRRCE